MKPWLDTSSLPILRLRCRPWELRRLQSAE